MTIEYQSPSADVPATHDHIYTTVLGVFAFFLLIGAGALLSLANSPFTNEQNRAAMNLGAYVAICYFVASVTVLVVRIWFPAKRRWVTLALNIALLLYAPFGTAIGAYGLFRVDKRLRQSENSN